MYKQPTTLQYTPKTLLFEKMLYLRSTERAAAIVDVHDDLPHHGWTCVCIYKLQHNE